MDPIINLYYRLYDGPAPLTSKHPFQPNHSNLSSIDINSIPPPYTVAKITQTILERELVEAELKLKHASAQLFIDRRDAKPAAKDVIVDIERGDCTKPLTAVRLVLRPSLNNNGSRAGSDFAGKAPTKTQLAMLWPNPGPPLTTAAPVHWPGISPASTAMLRGYLQRDYVEHHAYFNERGFHNHTPFHLLVEWVLGGTPPHLTAIWNQHLAVERKQFASPNPITEETFFDHLGDENYYQAYLYFFSDLVLRKPVERVLEEWLFDRKANFDCEKPGARDDGMVNRLFAGVMHPLIYVGYGLEFSLPGLVAEGLAQAAVHKNATSKLLPQYMFATSPPPHPSSTRSPGLHAFTILARIQRDRHFDNVTPKFKFDDIHKQYGEDIQRYANEWVVEGASEKEVKEKVRELVFLNVMIYAMGGWKDGEGFRYAEFTLMHLVTSSITLSSYMASLSSPSSKSIILRAYLSRSLAYWISRGRPILNPRSFFACPLHSPSTIPTIPNPKPTPNQSAFPAPTSPDALTPNPWLQIIQSALVHPDDHLGKFQRTLAYYGALYGGVEGGAFGKGETELEGCEVVDGTLFLRAAGVTMLRMGRVREGEKSEYWTNDPNFESSFASLT